MKETKSDEGDLLSGGGSSENKPQTSQSSSDSVLSHREPDAPVSKQDVAQHVDATHQQLLELQRKREELEREKHELEDLRRKQDEYDLGRKEMLERLHRSLIILEHEQIETNRRADHVANALESFKAAKEQIEAIRHDQWNNANLKTELTKALAAIETARNEFNHYLSRIDALDEKRNPDAAIATGPLAELAPEEGLLGKLKFGDLIKVGFAVSLPIIILGVIVLIVIAMKR